MWHKWLSTVLTLIFPSLPSTTSYFLCAPIRAYFFFFLNTPFSLTIECLCTVIISCWTVSFWISNLYFIYFLLIKHTHQLTCSSNMMISNFSWFLSAKQVFSLPILLEDVLHNFVDFSYWIAYLWSCYFSSASSDIPNCEDWMFLPL